VLLGKQAEVLIGAACQCGGSLASPKKHGDQKMPRPKWPEPYCVLTPACIQRIRSDQDDYDADPERSEREQAARKEREDEERLREQEY